ncbi:MAG TPA: hypothetical protein VK473_18335 [Terriglobales bacterium]|nr:hypothetical protein [Terriglobales bacterium]
MKTRAVLIVFFVSALLLLLPALPDRPAASSTALVAQITPQMPRGLSGGRPGIFRFIPREQLVADRAEIQQLRASLERWQLLASGVQDPITRRRLEADLELWQVHLDRAQLRLTASASPTAQAVEMQLNDMKGTRMCGVCHEGGVLADSRHLAWPAH